MERERWPLFDLLNGYVYQGSSNLFTVVHLAPAVGLDSTYLIRTLVSRVSDSGQTVTPLARYRVYATREGGRWVLGNALPRVTRAWRHETIGRITFVFPPTHMFDRVRAERSSKFVDSLARAFALSPAPAISGRTLGRCGRSCRSRACASTGLLIRCCRGIGQLVR